MPKHSVPALERILLFRIRWWIQWFWWQLDFVYFVVMFPDQVRDDIQLAIHAENNIALAVGGKTLRRLTHLLGTNKLAHADIVVRLALLQSLANDKPLLQRKVHFGFDDLAVVRKRMAALEQGWPGIDGVVTNRVGKTADEIGLEIHHGFVRPGVSLRLQGAIHLA